MTNDAHWFRGSKTQRLPQSWVFFYAAAQTERLDSGLEIETLRNVSGILVRRRKATWTVADIVDAESSDEWWQWIQAVIHSERSPWIYGYRVSQQMTLLRLWSLMERGIYQIRDTRTPQRSRVDPTRMRKPSHGIAVISDPPVILALWHQSGRQLRIVDVQNYYPIEWSDIASLIGREITPLPEKDATAARWMTAARERRDALRTLIQATASEWQSGKHGSWRASLSGLAMSSYRASVTKPRILIDSDQWSRRICRAAYYGGETRAFRLGRFDGPIYELDLASAYLWGMTTHGHPCKLLEVRDKPSVRQLWLTAGSTWAAAVVQIDSERYGYPVNRSGNTRQTRGIFWTALCGDELSHALERDLVQECEVAAIYARQYLFREWGQHWWHIRRQAERDGNTVLKHLSKVIPNAFYGRWAMQTGGWLDRPDVAADDAFGHWFALVPRLGETHEYRSIGGWVQERCRPVDGEDTLPAIAASITAAVRVRMRALIEIAGEDNCLWQAVDCLWVNGAGRERLAAAGEIRDGELGYLRPHGVYEWVEIYSPHAVETDRDLRVVGLRPSCRRITGSLFRQRIAPRLGSLISRHAPEQYTTAETDYQLTAGQAVGPVNELGTIAIPRLVDRDIPVGLRRTLRPEDVSQDDADNENENRRAAS